MTSRSHSSSLSFFSEQVPSSPSFGWEQLPSSLAFGGAKLVSSTNLGNVLKLMTDDLPAANGSNQRLTSSADSEPTYTAYFCLRGDSSSNDIGAASGISNPVTNELCTLRLTIKNLNGDERDRSPDATVDINSTYGPAPVSSASGLIRAMTHSPILLAHCSSNSVAVVGSKPRIGYFLLGLDSRRLIYPCSP